MLNKFVLIRSVYAGVHVGTLASKSGDSVLLTDARRIWRWDGANTLSEVSQNGVAEAVTRISQPVPEIEVLGVVEIIPCSDVARENLSRSRWGE